MGDAFWKLTHLPESTVDKSDSSHSGIVGGATFCLRPGLEGAEAAHTGCWKLFEERFEINSHTGLGFEFLVGEDRGGVTGALLEILRGGRLLEGIEAMLQRNGSK